MAACCTTPGGWVLGAVLGVLGGALGAVLGVLACRADAHRRQRRPRMRPKVVKPLWSNCLLTAGLTET